MGDNTIINKHPTGPPNSFLASSTVDAARRRVDGVRALDVAVVGGGCASLTLRGDDRVDVDAVLFCGDGFNGGGCRIETLRFCGDTDDTALCCCCRVGDLLGDDGGLPRRFAGDAVDVVVAAAAAAAVLRTDLVCCCCSSS